MKICLQGLQIWHPNISLYNQIMSQEQSNSCRTSIENSFTKSLSKVSISQIPQVQSDSSVLLPSLAQIVFGQRPHLVSQSTHENDDTKSLKKQNPDACCYNQHKRSAPGELQRQMALQIDDDSVINQRYCAALDLQKISALPLRTLILAKKLINLYASSQIHLIDQLEIGRKICLFAHLLLSALELKTLGIEQLQGQAELSLFAFDVNEMMKYIANLTESVSWAINTNLQNKQNVWLQLEQKIKDPDNKLLRRKFLSLKKFTSNQNASFCQGKLLLLYNDCQQREYVQSKQECSQSANPFIRYRSFEGEGENQLQIERQPADNHIVSASLVVEFSLNNSERDISFIEMNEQNTMNLAGMSGERLGKDVQDNLAKQMQSLDFSEPILLITENNVNDLSKKALSQVCENTQKEISNATEGYLTQIDLSFDGICSRKEDSELFKSSCMSGLPSGQSIINISSII